MDGMSELDCVHVTSGDGSLAILKSYPMILPFTYISWSHIGDSMRMYSIGGLMAVKRNLGVTKVALTLARRRDLTTIRELSAKK